MKMTCESMVCPSEAAERLGNVVGDVARLDRKEDAAETHRIYSRFRSMRSLTATNHTVSRFRSTLLSR
jgi:hypothetical protein